MTCGIYMIYNNSTEKYYIGSSGNIEKRLTRHIKLLKDRIHHSIYLQRSFNKHGHQSFFLAIVECCQKHDLIKREQFFLDTYKPEYNVSIHALAPMQGRKHTNKTKLLFSNAHKNNTYNLGRKASEATRQKLREVRKHKIFTIETKKKMSDTAKRVNSISRINFDEIVCRKIKDSNGTVYRSLTDAARILNITKQAICDNLKGRSKCTRVGKLRLVFTYLT